LEVDEKQQKYHVKSDENKRYEELFIDFNGKYMFIRYGPDKHTDKINESKNPFLTISWKH